MSDAIADRYYGISITYYPFLNKMFEKSIIKVMPNWMKEYFVNKNNNEYCTDIELFNEANKHHKMDYEESNSFGMYIDDLVEHELITRKGRLLFIDKIVLKIKKYG